MGASGPGEIEGTGYFGEESGAWACGPSARVKYGGVGGEIRVRPSAPTDPHQAQEWYVAGGAAAEAQSYTLIECEHNPCQPGEAQLPPTTVLPATHLVGGYDWRWVGFRAGGQLWGRYTDHDAPTPRLTPWPEASLRLGPLDSVYVSAGIGSYNVPTLLRPGAYVGLGVVPAQGWNLDLHSGPVVLVGGFVGVRNDVSLLVPILPPLRLGFGGAVTTSKYDAVLPEGRLSLVGDL